MRSGVIFCSHTKDYVSTNYWSALTSAPKPKRKGPDRRFFVSFVDDTCQLLLSCGMMEKRPRIIRANEIVISSGPSSSDSENELYQFSFKSEGEDPLLITAPINCVNPIIPDEFNNKSIDISIWSLKGEASSYACIQEGLCFFRSQARFQIVNVVQDLNFYSRKEAIEDGTLIDLSNLPSLKTPFACTDKAWRLVKRISKKTDMHQDEVMMHILEAGRERYRTLSVKTKCFDLIIELGGKMYMFSLHIGSGDHGERVTTLTLHYENPHLNSY